MNLSLLLARRYAFQFRNRRNLTHLISGISMFVIAAVTAAMTNMEIPEIRCVKLRFLRVHA